MVDFSNASSLALLDPTTREWSGAIVEAAGLDIRMLPELAPGTHGVGRVTAGFASATGLARETCVGVGRGDETASTLGAGAYPRGDVCDLVGTAEPAAAVASTPRARRRCVGGGHPPA